MGSLFGPKQAAAVQQVTSPQVTAEPTPPTADELRKRGRASLLTDSPGGVLGNAKTGRLSLTAGAQ